MKKILLLLPNFAIAQSAYIKPVFDMQQTTFYNAEESKAKSKGFYRTLSFAPSFGLKVGKIKNKVAYETGLIFNRVNQNFDGFYWYDENSKIEASHKLNYLQIPLLASFQLNEKNKVSYSVQTGLSLNYLISNTSSYVTKFYAGTANGQKYYVDLNYLQQGKNLDISYNETELWGKYIFTENLYRKVNAWAHLNLGAAYPINKQTQFTFGLNNSVSITNPENNTKLKGHMLGGNGDILNVFNPSTYPAPFHFHDRVSHMVIPRLNGERTTSFIFINSISLGLKYTLKNKK